MPPVMASKKDLKECDKAPLVGKELERLVTKEADRSSYVSRLTEDSLSDSVGIFREDPGRSLTLSIYLSIHLSLTHTHIQTYTLSLP